MTDAARTNPAPGEPGGGVRVLRRYYFAFFDFAADQSE